MKLLEAETKKLEYLLNLSYGTLYIPYSQRPYEWKEEQVLRLYNDYFSIFANEDEAATHILNFITIRIDEDDDSKKYIYDGQQRTVTSLLLLAALINKLKTLGNEAPNSANELKRLYLYSSHWRDVSSTNLKIIFNNEAANYMLHEHIFKEVELDENHEFSDYDQAIYDNYHFLNAQITKSLGENPSKEQLIRFIEVILDRVLIIIIETSYENIAEEMFETLNSTGLQIEDFYVLKNALIRATNEEIVKPLWASIELNTDRINKNKFLHAYINAINGKTPSDNLYRRISNIRDIDNSQTAQEFLQELKKASDLFMKIENPSQRTDGTQEENSHYLKSINTLDLLNANQYKPVIISMGLRDYTINEINQILDKIIALQLRNIFISENKANTLELFYPSLAKKIYNQTEINNIQGIIESLSNEMVNDTVLYEDFNHKQIISNKDSAIIRFILKEIYNSQHTEIVINTNSRDVNLEHILPNNPKDDSQWITDFPNEDERIILTRKIGNLTVLLNKLNSSIKNSDFNNKKSKYVESQIPENQVIGTLNEWKKSNIDQRTIALYNIFKSIWAK